MGVWSLAILTVAMAAPSAGSPVDDRGLVAGVEQAKNGDFEGAALTLDNVARDLAASPGRSKDLAQAYLYLGVAYLGLGQETLARSRFLQALQQDSQLHVGPEEFAPKVIRAFEASRRALAERAVLEKQAKRKRGKGGLILLGLGGAGAATIAALVTGERKNNAPTAAMAIAPQGAAVAGVTTLAFSASGSDPEGDALSFRWVFGDGQDANGPVASHVYAREGSYGVALLVNDGLTSSTATGSVTVKSLNGRWRLLGETFIGVTNLELFQRAGSGAFSGGFSSEVAADLTMDGLATDPRNVTLAYRDCNPNFGPCECSFRFVGAGDAQIQSFSGTLSCGDAHLECRRCAGRSQPVTLTRQ